MVTEVKRKCTIKELKTYEQGENWYMSAIVEVENETRVEEYRFPKIRLHNKSSEMQVDRSLDALFGCWCDTTVNLGFGRFACLYGEDPKGVATDDIGVFFVETIKEKTQEMTLEEIEKKLGYKVKIVSKK